MHYVTPRWMNALLLNAPIIDCASFSEDFVLCQCDFPAVVQYGKTMSAANVSKEWIGFDADTMFEEELGRDVHVLNDADAAGIAEVRFGAAREKKDITEPVQFAVVLTVLLGFRVVKAMRKK